jgi:PAS domain S-box-containing protein
MISHNNLESKLIEYTYYHNEAGLLECAEFSNYFVIKLTAEAKIEFINGVAEEIYGWSLKLVSGKNFNLLCAAYGFDSPLLDGKQNLRKESSFKLETCVLRPNGEKRYLSLNVNKICNADKQIEKILILGKDITDAKMAMEKEKAVGLYLTEIFSRLPVAVWWKDCNSTFQGCNDFCSKVAGLSTPDEIIGKTDFDLAWHGEEALSFRRDDGEVMVSNKPKFGIIEPQHQANGKAVTLFTSKIPIFDSSKKTIGTTGFFCDISANDSANLIYISNLCMKSAYMSFQNKKIYYFCYKGKITKLNYRQAECLTHLAMGKTAKETARVINLSYRTVEDYVNSLRNKLEINTKTELVEGFWDNPIKWF